MSRVLFSFDDLGLGVQLAETLEAAGVSVTWPREAASGPSGDHDSFDVVLLAGRLSAMQVRSYVSAWRKLPQPPGIVLFAPDKATQHLAAVLQVTAITPCHQAQTLVDRIRLAARLRYAGELSEHFALLALGVKCRGESLDRAVMIAARARQADPFMIREALRPYAQQYISTTDMISELRQVRALTVPEIELANTISGAATLGTIIDRHAGTSDPTTVARVLWAFCCIGAVKLTSEPPDSMTLERCAVARMRHHLRERRKAMRRGHASYYEVLEVTFEPNTAQLKANMARLAVRFSPQRLTGLDLGDLNDLVVPLWQQIERAWEMLYYPKQRAQYNEYLRSKGVDLTQLQADEPGAEADFVAGQTALSRGEVTRAVALFASATRRYPRHADYEAYLAWTRYRQAVDRGDDKHAAAKRERDLAERSQAGRQPRPRALLAIGLLCNACEDYEAARWHLRESLQCDPNFSLARQILQRLED